jgi:hypothetical protein
VTEHLRQLNVGLKGRLRPKKLGKRGEETARSPSPNKLSETELLAAAANAAAEAGVPFSPGMLSSTAASRVVSGAGKNSIRFN